MRQYLRLWRRFVAMAFARETEYRANVLVTLGEGVIQVAFAVAVLGLIYRYTETIAGWSWPDMLVLAGVYRTIEGLIALQVAPNMLAIGELIRRGDLDGLLLRPASSQFLASARLVALPEAGNVLLGLGLVLYAGGFAGVDWQPADVALAAGFALCGLVLLYALWFASVTLSFWLVQVDTLDQLFYVALEAARYPVTFFPSLARTLLTFVVPVAFATTFPAQALLGKADGRLLLVGALLAALALVGTNWFWRYALRHYSSASG